MSIYQSIITLNRLNIQLTQDAIRLLDQVVTAFNNSFIEINTISDLENRIRSIFPQAVANLLVPQLYGVARQYVSLENTLIEAKNITIRYAITLILRAITNAKPGGMIDAYDVATTILRDNVLQAFRSALPKFPYDRSNSQVSQPVLSGNVMILSGFMKGVDDYLVALQERLAPLTPQQLVLAGPRYGFTVDPTNPVQGFYSGFRQMLLNRALATGKQEIGFMDLIDILLTLK